MRHIVTMCAVLLILNYADCPVELLLMMMEMGALGGVHGSSR